ncbi:MAG: DUF1700 domain-containing protein [Oscillospiraceae bacterium]|nr:DUF1700 domain-containing protein [Oscillospiraceae bacterium]
MNKEVFLAQLEERLSGLPADDVAERLAFYAEMIDDRVEEGLSEEDAVAQIGPVSRIVEQTVAEIPMAKLVRERVKPNRRLQAWEVILLILGCPIWLSLLLAGFAVLFSAYIVIWAVLISLWAADTACGVASAGALAAGIACVCQGDGLQGLAIIGASIMLAGFSILLFFACRAATAAALHMTRAIAPGIKSRFIRKENVR